MRVAGIKIHERVSIEEFNAKALQLKLNDKVLVKKDNDLFLGIVAEDIKIVDKDDRAIPWIIRKIYSFETGEKFAYYPIEKEGFDFCKLQAKSLKMSMKLLKVKFLLKENKLIFFYSAEERVDFRELVKILAGKFHLRIEMRQINIRDECKLLGGIGLCGRMCCCNSIERESKSHISSKVTKLQCQNAGNLVGYCGRLLCCLVFDPPNPEEETCEEAQDSSKLFYNSNDSYDDTLNKRK